MRYYFGLLALFSLLLLPIGYSQEDDLEPLEELTLDVGDDFFDEIDGFIESDDKQSTDQLGQENREEGRQVNQPKMEKNRNEYYPESFDIKKEEQELLSFLDNIGEKISHGEWNEVIQTTTNRGSYTVVNGDTLWSISRTLFGSGFYYSKIWSLNPYITNPHKIEPGMVLTFSLGSEAAAPEIRLGGFSLDSDQPEDEGKEISQLKSGSDYGQVFYSQFVDDESYPKWFDEREELIRKGFHVQSASGYTYDDLRKSNVTSLIDEYKNYEPMPSGLEVDIPTSFDELGFDKSSVVRREFKNGFYLNTFIVSNIVQDFGEIQAGQKNSSIFSLGDIVYINFDPQINIAPGDYFSIYSSEGIVRHQLSEREGYRYSIKGHVKAKEKKNELWECEVTHVVELINRHDRITTYTPQIRRLLTTFNQRRIEAIVMGAYANTRKLYSYGDVVYLDRGRADGVELGNIFNVYSFLDRSTKKQITEDPTYKIGELRVITLSENFATALVEVSSHEVRLGHLAVTQTEEQAMRKTKGGQSRQSVEEMEKKALAELDVELELDDVGTQIKDEASKIELTEDEIEELERQEKEKSFIREGETDRQELDRLEQEVEDVEGLLNEVIEDENKQLEQQDINKIEEKQESPDPDAFESLDEIEEEVGRQYLDEDINARSNPFGLTEFDLEEVDELLNTGPEGEDVKGLPPEQLQ